ncbi:MAG: SRPBCC family protein [Acidimicrobiia bacterium]
MVPLTGSSREPTEDQWGLTVRQQSSGRFEVALPASAAIDLFTPEGERSWVPGWDPVYATGAAGETAGTVFTTTVDGLATIWTIVQIDRAAGAAIYSRVTPGYHAGIVRVWCVDAAADRTAVKVSYDMSLLGNDPSVLDTYADPAFGAMLAEWSAAIAASMA